MTLIQLGVLGAVALILGLFVVRPILAGKGAAAAPLSLPGVAEQDSPLNGEIDEDEGFAQLPALGSGPDFGGLGMVDFDSPAEEDPVDRLRALIEERKTETVEILRNWLDEKEEVK